MRRFLLSLFAIAGLSGQAAATVIVNVFDGEGGLTIDASGTLDTTGLTQFRDFSGPGDVRFAGTFEFLFFGGPAQLYEGPIAGPSMFDGNLFLPTNSGAPSFTGDPFGLRAIGGSGALSSLGGPELLLPLNFVSGSAISSRAVAPDLLLSETDLAGGTFTWQLPNDQIQLVIVEPAAVPLPASGLALLAGLGALAVRGRRKRLSTA